METAAYGCALAGVKPKQDIETGEDKLWVLIDLRKTAATYYDEHMPESSIEIPSSNSHDRIGLKVWSFT